MNIEFTPEDVQRLAAAVGVPFPAADLAPVAEALTAHAAGVAPLLHAVAADEAPWLLPAPDPDG